MKQQSQQGFTLIELMIVVAIIGILAAVALPQYQNYVAKAKFAEVVSATNSVRTAVEVCFQVKGSLAVCDTYAEIDQTQAGAEAGENVASVAITETTAVITATSVAAVGGGRTYILTPTVSGAGNLSWAVTGTCATAPALC